MKTILCASRRSCDGEEKVILLNYIVYLYSHNDQYTSATLVRTIHIWHTSSILLLEPSLRKRVWVCLVKTKSKE